MTSPMALPRPEGSSSWGEPGLSGLENPSPPNTTSPASVRNVMSICNKKHSMMTDPRATSTPAGRFIMFNNLPLELRLDVWEQHFSSSRVHIISPETCLSQPSQPWRFRYMYTFKRMPGASTMRKSGWLINREAYSVAERMESRRDSLCLAKDVSANCAASKWDGLETIERQHANFKGYADRAAKQPVGVNWETDLLYLASAKSGFSYAVDYLPNSICGLPWSSKVETVAWHLRTSNVDIQDFEFMLGPGFQADVIRFLDGVESLRELILVVEPDFRPHKAVHSANAPRGEYGFVECKTDSALWSVCDEITQGAVVDVIYRAFQRGIWATGRDVIIRRVLNLDLEIAPEKEFTMF